MDLNPRAGNVLSQLSTRTRIRGEYSSGGPHGRCSVTTSTFCVARANDPADVRGYAHRQHFRRALENIHGPATERVVVGAVFAHGDNFHCFCLHSGPENRFPQSYGKPGGNVAQAVGTT